MVVRRRERLSVRAYIDPRRRDVEHGDALDRLRMIEAQPMRDAPAAIVADEPEPREAERAHHLDLSAAIARFE